MGIAREAASWSKDPAVGVGAVLVSPDLRQVSWGFNGFPTGIDDSPERLANVAVKNGFMIHAELNALLNAAVDITGWTMYCTKHPCKECALAIIQKRIRRVVAPAIMKNSKWYDNQVKAHDLFMEARISTDIFCIEAIV